MSFRVNYFFYKILNKFFIRIDMLINTMVETYQVFDEFSIDVPIEIKNSIVELRQKFDEMMALVRNSRKHIQGTLTSTFNV